MIRRLVEANYFQNQDRPTVAQIRFWLNELRTPQLLIEVAVKNSATALKLSKQRPLLNFALAGEIEKLAAALAEEEAAEREKDRRYWLPLFKELEMLRHGN